MSPISFFNVATKSSYIAYVLHIIFALDSAGLETWLRLSIFDKNTHSWSYVLHIASQHETHTVRPIIIDTKFDSLIKGWLTSISTVKVYFPLHNL